MTKKKHIKLLPIILTIMVFLGLILFFFRGEILALLKGASQSGKGMFQQGQVEVTAITIQKQSINPFIDMPAKLKAKKIAELRPQVGGIIEAITFEEGGFVKKGKSLYSIDSDLYDSAYKSAKITLDSMQAKKSRYDQLIKKEAISQQEFEDMNVAVANAKQNLSLAKNNLARSRVAAPISGYIGKSNFVEGSTVSANQVDPLTTITQLSPIYADIELSSSQATTLKSLPAKNTKILITTEDKNYQETGKLKSKERFIYESTDSIRLRAEFENKKEVLIPGGFVNARILLPSIDAILVPQRAAIRSPKGELMVWIVDNSGLVSARIVKEKGTYNEYWIIESGIEEGESIVYEGIQKVSEGIKVSLSNGQ